MTGTGTGEQEQGQKLELGQVRGQELGQEVRGDV
jgi:hypothetical protein